MSERLALGQVDVEILGGHDRYEAASVMEFNGEEAAFRFLRGLLDNPRGLDAVRRALAPGDLHGTLRHAGPSELLRRLAREVVVWHHSGQPVGVRKGGRETRTATTVDGRPAPGAVGRRACRTRAERFEPLPHIRLCKRS